MSRYAALEAKCKEFNAAVLDYQLKSRKAVLVFRDGFRDYLGAPDDMLRLAEVDHSHDGPSKYKNIGGVFPSTIEPSGALRFGIVVYVRDGGQFILSFFDFRLIFKIDGCVFAHVDASERREFPYQFDAGPDTLIPAYAYMAEVLERSFDRRPWGERRIEIGFDIRPVAQA